MKTTVSVVVSTTTMTTSPVAPDERTPPIRVLEQKREMLIHIRALLSGRNQFRTPPSHGAVRKRCRAGVIESRERRGNDWRDKYRKTAFARRLLPCLLCVCSDTMKRESLLNCRRSESPRVLSLWFHRIPSAHNLLTYPD